MRFGLCVVALMVLLADPPGPANAQSQADPNHANRGHFAAPDDAPAAGQPAELEPPPAPVGYMPPTEDTKVHNYLMESLGPNPLGATLFIAAWHQLRRTPPDWREGMQGFGERYGSDFGTSLVNISTRFALAQATREDTLYYPCSCKAFWPRVRHTLTATVTARGRVDGHKVFALPTMVAPYVATTAAVYGWYPHRYNAKDAFRMGNFGLLDYYAANVSLEFLPSLFQKRGGSLITRLHLTSPHKAPNGETEP